MPEWKVWAAIKQRCCNQNSQAYANYGGRGIRMCDEWKQSFSAFLSHVGKRPSPEHSIERKENNGHYEPGNVCWALPIDQANNKRNNRVIEFNGQAHTAAVWARMYGLLPGTLFDRLDYGWTIEKALTTPVRKRRALTVYTARATDDQEIVPVVLGEEAAAI